MEELKLREYQKVALNYALSERRSVIVLPTGTGKTIIGIAFVKEILKRNPNSKALILVPTRILVEQTEKFYRKYGLEATKVYGILKKDERKELWKRSKIVISTPETAYNDLDYVKDFNVIIVDECHHAIGEDSYAKLLRSLEFEYALGLSAHVPKRRRREIEKLIGKIKEWSTSDPSIKKYIPKWIGDVYEAPFNSIEMEIYKEIENRRTKASKNEKLIYTLALRYFASDGALALKESISRKTKLSELLLDLRDNILKLRDMHKLEKLYKILNIYEDFEKCIIFVDRVIIAKKLNEILSKNYKTCLIIGRLKEELKKRLEEALDSEVIISTSAGEEGVDLPSADLLVVWSNTSSPLRFIQRHGRILRPSKPIKFVTYIVTPDTIDTDFFLIGIENAKKYIDIGIKETIFQEIWKKSSLRKILDVLYEPLTEEWIKEITGCTINEVREALRFGLKNGEIIYVYTNIGKVYIKKEYINILKEKFPENFIPKYIGKIKIDVGKRKRTYMGNFEKLYTILKNFLPLDHLKITIVKKLEEGILEYDYKDYKFSIDTPEVLETILRNALS